MSSVIWHDECTAVGETIQHKLLDEAADYVEAVANNLGLTIRVVGGVVTPYWSDTHWRGRPTLKLSITLSADVRRNVAACRLLTERLKRAFNAEQAGVDADDDFLWIIGMRPKEGQPLCKLLT